MIYKNTQARAQADSSESDTTPTASAGKAMKQTSKTAAELGQQEAPALGTKATSPPGSQPDETRKPDAGETHWSQASGVGLQEAAPKQPAERDESASSQAAESASMDAIGEIAYEDAVGGCDTDRGPVLDAVYNGSVTDGHRTNDDEDVHGERDPAKSTSSRKQ